jgi:hypothetical protein
MITAKLALAATAMTAAATLGVPAVAHAEPAPCATGQVQVSNGGEHRASGHRAVVLTFSLAPGAQACTLTGYPGVDSGAGGPLVHADRTPAGYLGGLRDTTTPPTVLVTAARPAHAVVEGVAVGADPDQPCPTYTELLVTPPDTADTMVVPVEIDTCELTVHPMGSTA